MKSVSLISITILTGLVCRSESQTDYTWKIGTNEVHVEIKVQSDVTRGEDYRKQTAIYLSSAGGSNVFVLFRPQITEVFEATVRNSAGDYVSKTSLGKSFGNSPEAVVAQGSIRFKGKNAWNILVFPKSSRVGIAHFNLAEHFKFTAPGEYVLTVRLRVYVENTGGQLTLKESVPYSVNFRVD